MYLPPHVTGALVQAWAGCGTVLFTLEARYLPVSSAPGNVKRERHEAPLAAAQATTGLMGGHPSLRADPGCDGGAQG